MNIVRLCVGVMLVALGLVSCSTTSSQSNVGEKHPVAGSLGLGPEGREVLEDAAMKGDVTAASRLGRYYALVEMNDAAARKWYEVAAKNGGPGERRELESFVRTRVD